MKHSATIRPADPYGMEELRCWKMGTKPQRVRFAEFVAAAMVQSIETDPILQAQPKKRSLPRVVSVVESDHNAFGTLAEAFGAYEASFFTIRFEGGAVVNMSIAAYETDPLHPWKVTGAGVRFYLNDTPKAQRNGEKHLKRFVPDEVNALLQELAGA